MIGEFINAISFADSKFWRTLKSILLNSGRFSRDFMDGRRKKYMRPIAIFLFANLVYFLFPLFTTFHSSLGNQISTYNFVHSDLASELVHKKVANEQTTFQEYEVVYNSKTKELSKVFLILVVVIIALLQWLFHNPTRFYLSEHLVLSFELVTFMIIVGVQFQGVLMHFLRFIGLGHIISEMLVTSIALVLLLYFLIRSEISFFNFSKLRAILNSTLGIISFAVAIYTYRIFLFFITFWST
ncbi:MAG: DUF3667 domain-containing protein [Ekhidna sp.]